ncbi:hypothetical protein BDU57DRAFT_592946 [Ampelomyces quisqualis]|uniref:Lysine-specific metallo-endopeptidase domain-containing protein n=1 Tax=Ampelomyces quisqualis TaxID=50730 RepID=A0A6A5QT36_AMPQU|nr:hypothetical protein BDU57DRAFT_592946 [Ampelomyces quisqualis]
MLFFRLIQFLAYQCLLLTSVLSYQIDQSCVDEGLDADLRDAMTSAFEMVDAARNRLNAEPMDQNTLELLGWLFGRKNQAPDTIVTNKIIDVFGAIRNAYRPETPRGNPVGLNDIVIFCNTARYRVKDAQKKLFEDSTNGEIIRFDEQICKGKRFPRDIMEKVALAVTTNPTSATGFVQPTQIQLCPWFVQWVKDHKYKMVKDAMMTSIGKTLIKLAGRAPFSFAQIDAFNLLDKVLLHEMMHGRAAWKTYDDHRDLIEVGLNDVELKSGYFGLHMVKAVAYGWSKATKLASESKVMGSPESPDANADSLALFGSSKYSNISTNLEACADA